MEEGEIFTAMAIASDFISFGVFYQLCLVQHIFLDVIHFISRETSKK